MRSGSYGTLEGYALREEADMSESAPAAIPTDFYTESGFVEILRDVEPSDDR